MNSEPPANAAQARRWRAPLLIVTLAGWLFALCSGSVLLFFILDTRTREFWALVHWLGALIVLAPYAIYQLRHYLRVRASCNQTHYRVGLHAFWLICGTIATGLPLIVPLVRGSLAYSAVDLAHIFFGYAFTLLICAHLTLVAAITLARAPAPLGGETQASIRFGLAVAAALAIGLLAVCALA